MKVSQTVHPDLLREIKKTSSSSHDLREYLQFIYGFNRLTKQTFDNMNQVFQSVPNLHHNPDFHSWSKTDQMLDSIKKYKQFESTFGFQNDENQLLANQYLQAPYPLTVHYFQFIPTIKAIASDEQQKVWIPMIEKYEMMGAYAQTELAHGSDIQRLQTTAHYDHKNKQFILNSPTIDSIKFWPGELGIHANHALVFAQLIIDGNSYGLNCFLLRIRDDKHQVVDNIELGDIGSKFGYLSKDNGYLKMNNVRIPKTNLLNRFCDIDENGEFEIKGDPRAMYAGMMEVRSTLSIYTWSFLAQSLTISTRYSFLRKQFKNSKHKEQAIVNYQLQQQKLLSGWAKLFGILGSVRFIVQLVQNNKQQIIEKNEFNLLQETHITLAGCKFYFTEMILKTCEKSRLACGGHGFHQFSQLPGIRQEATANITLEGENTVMTLQVTRYLLKQYRKIKQATNNDKNKYIQQIRYFLDHNQLLNEQFRIDSIEQLDSIDVLTKLMSIRACNTIEQLDKHLNEYTKQGLSAKTAWDTKSTIQGVEAAKNHVALLVMNFCYQNIKDYDGTRVANKATIELLFNLLKLYGIDSLLENANGLIELSTISPQIYEYLEELREMMLDRLRPEMASLSEFMDFNEIDLRFSALGRQDGKVYESLLELARKTGFNQKKLEGVKDVLATKEAIKTRQKSKL